MAISSRPVLARLAEDAGEIDFPLGMCGIAGVVDKAKGREARLVAGQLHTLCHRGPDSEGIHDGGVATIGQTRLAVVDLLTGDPPITNEDGTLGVAFNGEIYNFRALREELQQRGHHLRTSGDTEVIAHLAEELGPVELASALQGMFAFAVADDHRRRVILARDRLGKKPLYYWAGDGGMVFGSEIKALLAHPSVPRRLDSEAIPAFLSFGYVPTPRTFFEGICSLPPGHVLVFEPGAPPKTLPYWTPPLPGVNGCTRLDMSLEEAAAAVRSCLTQAVSRRLIADVPIGAFLSGGIDSSTIVALMASLMDRPVRTFTIGFEDNEGFDERPYALFVAERFATDHVEFVVRPDAVDLIETLVFHYDQPFGDSSAIPTFLLSELTRKHVTVALCGDGGDELFAGYERFSAALALHKLGRLPSKLIQGMESAATALESSRFEQQGARLKRHVARAGMDMPDAFRSWISYLPDDRVSAMLVEPSAWAIDDYRRLWAETDGADLRDRLLNLNVRTYLLDDLLPKVDRMSMAHGLEVRSPLLDVDLVELAFRLPPGLKTQGFSRKRVLKKAVGDLLPAEILHRRKHGFGIPLDRWFRDELRSYVEARLLGQDAKIHSYLKTSEVESLWLEHQAGFSHGHALWALLTLELFLRSVDW